MASRGGEPATQESGISVQIPGLKLSVFSRGWDDDNVLPASKIERAGWEDGQRNMPPSDATDFTEKERDIVNTFQEALSTWQAQVRHGLNLILGAIDKKANECVPPDLESRSQLLRARVSRTKHDEEEGLIESRRKQLQGLANLNYFKADGRLKREAEYPESKALTVGIILVAFLFESILNSQLFAEVDQSGIAGGYIKAAMLSIINVAIGFMIGYGPLRGLHLRAGPKKTIALFFTAIGFIVIPGYNYAVGSYRDKLEQDAAILRREFAPAPTPSNWQTSPAPATAQPERSPQLPAPAAVVETPSANLAKPVTKSTDTPTKAIKKPNVPAASPAEQQKVRQSGKPKDASTVDSVTVPQPSAPNPPPPLQDKKPSQAPSSPSWSPFDHSSITQRPTVVFAQIADFDFGNKLSLFEALSYQSLILFAFGMAVAIIACYEGYKFDDRYPGFGSEARKYAAVEKDYREKWKSFVLQLNRLADNDFTNIETDVQLFESRVADLRYLHSLFHQSTDNVAHSNDLFEKRCEQVLRAYREANQAVRATPAPITFKRFPKLAFVNDFPRMTPDRVARLADLEKTVERLRAEVAREKAKLFEEIENLKNAAGFEDHITSRAQKRIDEERAIEIEQKSRARADA